MKKFLDYEWNPVLFVLWSYSYSIRRTVKANIEYRRGMS